MNNLRAAALCLAFVFSAAVQAQTSTIYDEALQNSWSDFSFGGGSNFASTAEAHLGTTSISFVGNNFNAVSFAREAPDTSTATYPVLRFWIHGGTTGGQQIRLYLQRNAAIQITVELDSYIEGGSVAAGTWRKVTVPIGTFVESFDRIDLQSDQAAAQGVLYIDDVVLGQVEAEPVVPMVIENGVTVASMVSDRFTWQDSNRLPRVAVLAHNDGQNFNGARGGALREFRYRLPTGHTRIAGVTTYPNAGYAGFGYVVSHASRSTCVGDDSPLGGFQPGNGYERVFEGRHHAIFRFKQDYPRNCATTGGLARKMPVTIDWVFSTGRDNPLWAVTYDVDLAFATAGGAIAPANTFYDDSRAPYGELNIDGDGSTSIDGTAWGDRWKFTTTTSPITLNSAWTWNVANTVPYVKEWLAGPLTIDNKKDATMGIVQTQTLDQQDAAGARDPGVGSDIRGFWNKTSAMGNACGGQMMPCENDWPYQANANSVQFGNNNARMTWKTQYGFLGQNSYTTNNGGPMTTAAGYPKVSYSTYIVLGTHTSSPVETQVTQVETMQSVVLSADVGSVVTSGPAGITRADTVTYDPPGYNHVYGALAFSADGNALDANIEVGNGTLEKALIVVSNYTGGEPAVTLDGAVQTADADYFASLREEASELWITLNADLSGAVNHLEIAGAGGGPAAPTNVVATPFSSTRVDLTWTAVAGADSYEVDRKAAGGAFTLVGSPAGNSFSDTTASANTAYLYQVRAVNGGGTSANSTPDLATTVIFTDSVLSSAIKVKATHLTQLRTAVNAVRALAGLGAAAVTDPTPTGVRVKGVHITELRTALDAARSALSLSTGGYTDASLAAVKVKAIHITQLRDRVK
ncbi:MAG: fibronectin type III domain-containing protein [Thermoanaerobaculia bacterium]